MKYSVIIPTFNRIKTLERAIESVLCQTLPAEQLIVVDDGSIDGTFDWLQQRYLNNHHSRVFVIHQKNSGVSAARNKGFEKTSTDWVALLDSDDEWLPQKMQKQADEIEKTGLRVCHSEEIWIRDGARVNPKRKHRKNRGNIFHDCLKLCAMSPSAIVLHRSIWEEFNGFDESFIVCEDYDLWLRICNEYSVALVDEPLIRKYGGHADQLSRQYFGMDKYRIIAMQKLLGVVEQKDKVLSLRKEIEEKLMVLYKGALKHQNNELIAFCEERYSLFNIQKINHIN